MERQQHYPYAYDKKPVPLHRVRENIPFIRLVV